ncbi:MAG TPA: LPS-assembly protein LptD [Xanthobacteraceae bacterium]|nr:LPS-assembly protein LptD [Xanthobacteraceae bacterium]
MRNFIAATLNEKLAGRVQRAAVTLVCVTLGFAFASAAFAQSLPRSQSAEPSLTSRFMGQKAKRDPNAKMLVTANEMIYDTKNNRVHAVGGVQIYHDGAVLEADKVTYDRVTNKMFAEGSVRYRAKDGNVIHANALEMTQDFREAFVNSMLVETPQRTRFAAARADRTEGNITVFSNGVYTACEPCRDNPKKPPLWQVKAAKIIHNEGERTVYYEDATIELFGTPVGYLPYFYHPDPTVKRQSGFLPPHIYSNRRTGFGFEMPYFWSIRPNMDATVSVAPFVNQGVMVKGEFRHRLENGAYQIRAAGINQANPQEFSGLSGNRDFRGMIEAQGEFNINKRWLWGFDGAALTDRAFLSDYHIARHGVTERTSQIYLTGQSGRNYFDVRALHFFGLSELDNNNQLPNVHPVLDYSYFVGKPILGGELSFKVNFASISRDQAEFTPIQKLAIADYEKTSTSGATDVTKCLAATATPANCFVRALPGDYTRLSAQMDWRRTITSDVTGILITPFARLRTDIASYSINAGSNAAAFTNLAPNDELVRAMPTVGFEARWPFISVHSWGTQTLEPIVQAIFRPNETQIGRFWNEDAQSLVFDDTNLFAIDKYSGYDRVEGGSRLNYGLQYTANIHRFGMVNVLFGQSYQMFGQNSFAQTGFTDAAGNAVGPTANSGLEERASDYVARLYFQPTGRFSFINRFRFDKDDFSIRRMESEVRSTWDRLTLATIYARYEAQPMIGYIEQRHAIYQTATYQFHDYWSITGGIRYDLERGRIDLGTFGLTYADECFAITATYIADYTNTITAQSVHKFLLRVNLRTLGETGFKQNLGTQVTSTTPANN